jgi:hypothetical protein
MSSAAHILKKRRKLIKTNKPKVNTANDFLPIWFPLSSEPEILTVLTPTEE